MIWVGACGHERTIDLRRVRRGGGGLVSNYGTRMSNGLLPFSYSCGFLVV